jgi:hypothetical protein
MEADLVKGKRGERELLDLFGRLAPAQQDKMIAFAELLAGGAPDVSRGERVIIARSTRETVTMALRRLVRSYPMLDRRRLMGEASQLMAQHALEGRAASEVIDDLEAMFERHYKKMKSDK